MKFLLSILSGILLILSFPPYNLHYLSWMAFVPFFIATRNQSLKQIFLTGFVHGCCFFIGLFYGILLYGLKIFFYGLLYFSLNIAIFSLLTVFLQSKLKKFHLLIPPLIWTSLEYLRSIGTISFPTNLGICQYQSLLLIQLSSITGIYGISFLIMLINSFIAEFILKTYSIKSMIKSMVVSGLVIVLIIGSNYININRMTQKKSHVDVSIIQGSIPIWLYKIERWDKKYSQIVKNTYLKLTTQAIKHHPNLIIWPETNLHRFILDSPKLKDKIFRYVKEGNLFMIIGTLIKIETNQFNSAIIISPKGKVVGRYDKVYLVPIAEKKITRGMEIKPIKIPIGNIGINICFESLYPSISRILTQKGANILIILTNDAWFKKSSIPYLHAANAVFRAVENRRFVIRAAQSGISMIIDPYGRIIKQSELFKPCVLSGKVGLMEELTFYTKFGDLFCYLCLILSIGFVVFSGKGKKEDSLHKFMKLE